MALLRGCRSGSCGFSENICTIPKAGYLSYNAVSYRCSDIAEEFQMHWVLVFVMAWFSFGLAKVIFMFWFCKQAAAAIEGPIQGASFALEPAEFGASNLTGELRSA